MPNYKLITILSIIVGTISGANLSANTGDLVFDGADHILLVQHSYLYRIDTDDLEAEYLGNTGVSNLAGLAWDEDHELIACNIFSSGSYILKLNKTNGHVQRYRYTSTILYDLAGEHPEEGDEETPDISVAKSVNSDSLTIGSGANYTITISNSGDGDGHISTITDDLPANFTYVVGSTSGLTQGDPAIDEDNQLNWQGNWTLETGQQVSLNFQASVGTSRGLYYNSALVEGSNFNPAGTDPTAPVQVIGPDLALSIIVNHNTTSPGDTLTYQVIYQNTGDDEAQSVIMLQGIPENTTFIPGSISGTGLSVLYSDDDGSTYSSTPGPDVIDIQFQLNSALPPAGSGVLEYRVKVN